MTVILMLWMVVNGEPSRPPNKFEMESLDACYNTLVEKLDAAAATEDHEPVRYYAACILQKDPPA